MPLGDPVAPRSKVRYTGASAWEAVLDPRFAGCLSRSILKQRPELCNADTEAQGGRSPL